MSGATSGAGDGTLSAFIKHHDPRNLSRLFLGRNTRKVLQSHLDMGKALSSLRTPTKRRAERPEPTDDEDEEPRPAKRRRPNPTENDLPSQYGDDIGIRKPLGQVTNHISRPPSRLYRAPDLVEPSDFYGTKSTKIKISSILTKSPAKFKETLRVDVVEILAEPDEDEDFALSHPRKSPIEIKCKCSISIFYAKNDEKPGEVSREDFTEICRTVKLCTLLITFGEDNEVSRKIVMPEPFLFTPSEFYINRKFRKPNGQWASTTARFADKYYLEFAIHPIGHHKDWPPVDLAPYDEAASGGSASSKPVSKAIEANPFMRDELYFVARTENRLDALMDPDRQARMLRLELRHQSNLKQFLDPYKLKLEIRWALPTTMSSLPIRTPKTELSDSSRTVLTAPASHPFLESPVRRIQEDISASNSPAGDRAARQRSKVATYNLKALSAQAQGKSPRVRKTKASNPDHDDDGISVSYSLHPGDAADVNAQRTTIVSGLRCAFCNYLCGHVEDLRLHLHSNHSRFKFHLRKSTPPRITFSIDVVKVKVNYRSGATVESERGTTFQFGKPMSLFDLEKHLRGDETWTRRRQGPLHNTWPDRLLDRAHDSSHSSSPHESRHSSPNTSNDTDDLMEFEHFEKKLTLRPRKTYIVPKTKKPLYDSITKRVLEPGEELFSSDEEKELGWLHHRNRDTINDFQDVSVEEKDFINTYNPFIVNENLSSVKYLPEAILRFVETYKSWFAERSYRKMEFLKLMEVLIMRGDMDEKCLTKCMDILRAAEKTNKGKDVEMNEDDPPKPRGLMDCICGEHAKPPDRIICRGPHCPGRFFHPKCAEESFGRPATGIWKCNHCVS